MLELLKRRKVVKHDEHEPLMDGVLAVEFIKNAYGLLPGQTPRFDMDDPVQTALRRIKGWIDMAQHDALQEDPRRTAAAYKETNS